MVAMVMAFSPTAESEPRRIALALKRKDPDLIGELVSRYHYRLLRYVVYLTSRREAAEDLIQETWLRVLECGGQYNGRSRFEPWLFSIARNLAIDHLRQRQRTALGRGEATDAEAVLELPAADRDSPFLAAARSEDAGRIASALAQLEPIYREALLLRFQEDLSLAEIAEIAGVPLPTISSRIQRGLALLRSHLEGDVHAV